MERPSSVVEKELLGVIAIKGAEDVVSVDIDPEEKLVEKGVHAKAFKNKRGMNKAINNIMGKAYGRRRKGMSKPARRDATGHVLRASHAFISQY